MALLIGLGGEITRDVLANHVPGALTHPAYITVALACAIVGLLACKHGELDAAGPAGAWERHLLWMMDWCDPVGVASVPSARPGGAGVHELGG